MTSRPDCDEAPDCLLSFERALPSTGPRPAHHENRSLKGLNQVRVLHRASLRRERGDTFPAGLAGVKWSETSFLLLFFLFCLVTEGSLPGRMGVKSPKASSGLLAGVFRAALSFSTEPNSSWSGRGCTAEYAFMKHMLKAATAGRRNMRVTEATRISNSSVRHN